MKRIIPIFLILFSVALHAQTWTPRMDELARTIETEYNLPHGICRAFALQESGYNPYAVRAEGNYINAGGRYASNIRKQSVVFAIAHHYQPSILTEVVQRGQSWTMWQIMGQNLRELGFDSPFFGGEMTLDDQFEYFAAFIGNLLKKHKGNVAYAASEYNGGFGAIRKGNFRNAGYVNNILKYLKQFSY